MSAMNVNRIGAPAQILNLPREVPKAKPEEKLSFGEMIKNVVGEAVQADQEAANAIEEFAAGNIQDVHDVVVAVNKANLAIGLLVEIRNGLIQAYNEISKIQM